MAKVELSLGGNIRSEFQAIVNEEWIKDNNNIGITFQRYMAHADWRLGKNFRIFGELKSGYTINRNGPPSPLDLDRMDVHQLYAEIRSGASRWQIGRKELWYGSRRLISIREGTNIRQSFDGLRWIWENKQVRQDLLLYWYNPQEIGFFDNRIRSERWLWGIYQVWKVPQFPDWQLDLYYLGVDNISSRFEAGNFAERRHSVGFRHWGKSGGFRYNTEVIYQWGSFGEGLIRA